MAVDEPGVVPGVNLRLKVNLPDVAYGGLAGVTATRMGRSGCVDKIVARVEPRGGDYYWIGGTGPGHHSEPGTGFDVMKQGKVSITLRLGT
jgi:5'-nucleotidase